MVRVRGNLPEGAFRLLNVMVNIRVMLGPGWFHGISEGSFAGHQFPKTNPDCQKPNSPIPRRAQELIATPGRLLSLNIIAIARGAFGLLELNQRQRRCRPTPPPRPRSGFRPPAQLPYRHRDHLSEPQTLIKAGHRGSGPHRHRLNEANSSSVNQLQVGNFFFSFFL